MGDRGRGDTIILRTDDAQGLYDQVRSAGVDVKDPRSVSTAPRCSTSRTRGLHVDVLGGRGPSTG